MLTIPLDTQDEMITNCYKQRRILGYERVIIYKNGRNIEGAYKEERMAILIFDFHYDYFTYGVIRWKLHDNNNFAWR